MNNNHALFLGRIVSMFGDALYSVAIMWYVFDVTKDAFITGIASAILTLPMVLGIFIGPIIDHFNRKSIVLTSQILQLITMCIIAVLINLNLMPLYLLLLSFFIISLLENFEGNAESALTPLVISEEDLLTFNSKVQTFNLIIKLVAKMFSISIILVIGIGSIYIINAFTFLAAAFFFYKIKYIHKDNGRFDKRSYSKSIKEGLNYFFRNKMLAISLPIMFCNFTGAMTDAALPAFAYEKGGDIAYGYYLSSSVLFSIIGSLIVPYLKNISLLNIFIISPAVLAIFMVMTVITDELYKSLFWYGMVSIPLVIMNITFGTYIQTSVENKILARVTTILTTVCTASLPLGSLFGGYIGKVYHPGIALYIAGIGFGSITFIFLFKKLKGLKNFETFN